MKKLLTNLFLITILLCILFVSACYNENSQNEDVPPSPPPPQILYDITTIKKSLAFEDYEDVFFSTNFATISISTQTGLIGLYNMQGEMKQVSTSSIVCSDYDAIKIENFGLWNSTIRRVKITYYQYETIILDAYSTSQHLEAQGYILCDSKIVTIHMV